MATVLFGLDLATKLGATLHLMDRYWSAGDLAGRDEDYTAVWNFLRIPNATAAVGLHEIPGKLKWTEVLAQGPTLPCRSLVTVGTGHPWSCNGHYCFPLVHGVMARNVKRLRARMDYAKLPEASPALRDARQQEDRETIAVLWHLRFGDIEVDVSEDALKELKQRIHAGLAGKVAAHYVLVENGARLREQHPGLEAQGFRIVEESEAIRVFGEMVRATILVSTGSSFAVTAAAAAPTGKQVHYFFPPKETQVCRSEEQCRTSGQDGNYRSYFFPSNTIPVASNGKTLQGYEAKERHVLRAIALEGHFSEELADLSYELWL